MWAVTACKTQGSAGSTRCAVSEEVCRSSGEQPLHDVQLYCRSHVSASSSVCTWHVAACTATNVFETVFTCKVQLLQGVVTRSGTDVNGEGVLLVAYGSKHLILQLPARWGRSPHIQLVGSAGTLQCGCTARLTAVALFEQHNLDTVTITVIGLAGARESVQGA
jgi:hypothetical protein